jgi:hypothetical protein
MKFSLSTPNWTKVFKDNYRKYSVPTGACADDITTMKVPVFEQGSLNKEASKPHSTGANSFKI